MELLFWLCLGFIFYAYFGYPLALVVFSLFRSSPVRKGEITPPVSFIIAAHNEEKRIKEKIENTLRQHYPRDRFEIIVASDCSTDTTDDIVKSFAGRNVKLVRAAERRGKEHAQQLAAAAAIGDILIFSDVSTILDADGVPAIVKNFADPTVGCVSSVDKFIDKDGRLSGEGAYVRYEMLLRKLESRVNTLVGLSGSFFAARKEICRNWTQDWPSDFNILLKSVQSGLRGVTDPKSVGYNRNISDEKKEFQRKVRTILRGITTAMASRMLLHPVKYGVFSWQLFSHKICRWLVPYALLLVFIANSALISRNPYYLFAFVIQCLFYALSFIGARNPVLLRFNVVRFPLFFVVTNISILKAWYKYLRGDRIAAWNPSER